MLSSLKVLLYSSVLLQQVLSSFNATEQHLAVYWGQAEAGEQNQSDLKFYCGSCSVDTIVLAFISQFGRANLAGENGKGFVLNLSDSCSDTEAGDTVCPQVSKDIKSCQELGKKVLISLGGEMNEEEKYGFANDEEAREFAHVLWDYFGEGSTPNRPFGDAIVDGFDFDIETTDQVGYLALAQELKRLTLERGSKKYWFTAAPQCNLPDEHMSKLIENFQLDELFIQFYNNEECELLSDGFNFDQWVHATIANGHNDTKLLIGLPSSRKAAASGFLSNVQDLQSAVRRLTNDKETMDKFGGLMFWDASRGFDQHERDSSESSYIFRAWSALNVDDGEEEASQPSSGVTITNGTSSPYMPKTTTSASAGVLCVRPGSVSMMLLLVGFLTIIILL